MKQLFCFSLLLLQMVSFAKYRPIDIISEIEKAKHVGEIVFTGYDSINISEYSATYQRILKDSLTGKEYGDTVYSSTVWNMGSINFKPLRNINPSIQKAEIQKTHSWNYYHPRPKLLPKKGCSNGFWPRKGDTCIVIIDSLNRVSLFGVLINGSYLFWDPYPNSSCNSIIAFDAPFQSYPGGEKNAFEKGSCRSVSTRFKRESASNFHCIIEKNRFWKEVINTSD